MLPKDPVILLSVINTKLRDFYPTLDALDPSDAVNHTLSPAFPSAAALTQRSVWFLRQLRCRPHRFRRPHWAAPADWAECPPP